MGIAQGTAKNMEKPIRAERVLRDSSARKRAKPPSAPPQMSKEQVYAGKLALLRSRGYRSVKVDWDGRIVVEVDDSNIDHERAESFRRVWGPEWPVVRSDRWNPMQPADDRQLEFNSRGIAA